jgi:protein gp37
MSGASRIEWTQVTWNPVTGCDRISAGCDHCYALALARRFKALGQPKYQADGDPRTSGPGFGVTWHPEALTEPYRWGGGRLVFVNSMSDLFHARVPVAFIDAVLKVCQDTPWHTYQVLTKRPRFLAWHLSGFHSRHGPLPNVWFGVSVEHAKTLHRLAGLQQAPAALRFLSCEPLLGPLPDLDLSGIGWVIVGGESGPGARPLDLNWIREIRDQAQATGVATFVKQLGSHWARRLGGQPKGGDPSPWPADLRVRELPARPTYQPSPGRLADAAGGPGPGEVGG